VLTFVCRTSGSSIWNFGIGFCSTDAQVTEASRTSLRNLARREALCAIAFWAPSSALRKKGALQPICSVVDRGVTELIKVDLVSRSAATMSPW
jgi:hypothetical protein